MIDLLLVAILIQLNGIANQNEESKHKCNPYCECEDDTSI